MLGRTPCEGTRHTKIQQPNTAGWQVGSPELDRRLRVENTHDFQHIQTARSDTSLIMTLQVLGASIQASDVPTKATRDHRVQVV